MDENIYAATAIDLDVQAESATKDSFYIVSPTKLALLFIFTMGIYTLYWHYKNWNQYKKSHDDTIWPIPRAIFSIFFTHSLYENISIQLQEKQSNRQWDHAFHATILVISSITMNICDRLAYKEIGMPYTEIMGFALLPIVLWQLFRTQILINEACEDHKGESNAQLTPLNFVWMLVGSALWALTIWSFFAASN
jgi:hypothetical protein